MPVIELLPSIDGQAAGHERDRFRRAAVVCRPLGSRPGVGDADLIAIGSVGQPAGSARADQVVRAAGRDDDPAWSRDVVGRTSWDQVLPATIVLYRVTVPALIYRPPPVLFGDGDVYGRQHTALSRVLADASSVARDAEFSAIVALTRVKVPSLKMPPPSAAELPAARSTAATSEPSVTSLIVAVPPTL